MPIGLQLGKTFQKYIKWKQGERISDRYEVLLPRPKEGGMGCVYICLDHRYNIPVAIKTLKEDLKADGIDFENLLEKFRLEAEAWVRLEKHRNIVQAKRVEVIEGQPYIILEYINAHEKYGANLSNWIKRKNRFSIVESLEFAIQFCSGMEHAKNIFNEINKTFVHRDIKPANIMVTPDGVIKITDFGLVKIFDDATKDVFVSFGTPRYMSPEQFQSECSVDTRSDIYSFGCVFFEMLSKSPPFLCSNYIECQQFHVNLMAERIETIVPQIPNNLSCIIDKCLQKDKRKRFNDFSALKHDLKRVYRDLTGEDYHQPVSSKLASWERIQKGISLSTLGFRKESVTSYIQALEVDHDAAKQFIPAALAKIRDIHCPGDKNQMLLILILSFYVNETNQRCIAEILDLLVSRYGIRIISVEGGSGKIDLSYYRSLPNVDKKIEVAEILLKQGKINGTEFFAITTMQDIALYGAEDQNLFNKNTAAFISGLSIRNSALQCCDFIQQALALLKMHLYNSDLQALDQKIREKKHQYDYGFFLIDQMESLSIVEPHPNLRKYLKAVAIEKQINKNLLNQEKDAFFLQLSKSLSQDLIESVNKAIYDFTAKASDEYAFYAYINSVVEKNLSENFFDDYPNFKLLMKRMILFNELDHIELFSELDYIEEAIRSRLYTDLHQKELDIYLTYISLLRKGYENKLSPAEKNHLDKMRMNITDSKMVHFIRSQAEKHAISCSSSGLSNGQFEMNSRSFYLPFEAEKISDFLEASDAFYSMATQRSYSIVENCVNQLNSENELAGVLVVGGFHRETIMNYLKQRRVPFIVLTPNVELSEDDDKRYRSAILSNPKNDTFP